MWLCIGRLKSWLVHEASSTLVPLCQRCLPTQTHEEICSLFLKTAVLNLQNAITLAQPQAMLKVWVSGAAWGLPIELQNKCIVFIWKMQTHNSPTFYNSLRFCGKSAEKKSTKLLSGPHFTVQMKNPSESRCTEMLIWYNDHNVMLFFPFSWLESSGTWKKLTCLLAQE